MPAKKLMERGPTLNTLSDFFAEPQGADGEEEEAHGGEDGEIAHMIAEIGAAKDDAAEEVDIVGGGEDGAEPVKKGGHGFTGEDEA